MIQSENSMTQSLVESEMDKA
jgi:signal transduction histidine kinase